MIDPSEEKRETLHPEHWLEDHADYLFRYALLRLRDREGAEDVVQETFLAALKGKEQFRGDASERTWLVGILKHKVIDYFRKRSRELPGNDFVLSEDPSEDFFDSKGRWNLMPAPWTENPKEALEKKEFWGKFSDCMAELPGRSARVFALRELEGLKGEEICKILDISATNLSVILHRARLRLARCLEANWFNKQ